MIVYEEEMDKKVFKHLMSGGAIYTKSGVSYHRKTPAYYKYTYNENYALSPFVKHTMYPVEIFNNCNVDIVPSQKGEVIISKEEGERWELLEEMCEDEKYFP